MRYWVWAEPPWPQQYLCLSAFLTVSFTNEQSNRIVSRCVCVCVCLCVCACVYKCVWVHIPIYLVSIHTWLSVALKRQSHRSSDLQIFIYSREVNLSMKRELIAPSFTQPVYTLRALLKLKQQFIMISRVEFIYVAPLSRLQPQRVLQRTVVRIRSAQNRAHYSNRRPQTPVTLKVTQDIHACTKSENRFAHTQTQRSLA